MSFVTALFRSMGTVLSLGSISAPVPDLFPVPKAPARLGSAGGRSWLLPASRCLPVVAGAEEPPGHPQLCEMDVGTGAAASREAE